jgi:hypothetical protein
MRRGLVILAVVLIALAGVGVAVGAYHAGETHGLAQQIQTLPTTTSDGTQAVRVVDPAYGYGYGWHGGFFPFGLFVFPLFIIGIILLVRALVWRPGPWRGWGPGGPGGYGGGPGGHGGPRDEWMNKAEAWHREMHERGEPGSGEPSTPAPPAA